MAFDPDDSNIVYLTGPGGTVSRYNRRTGFSQDVTPWPLLIWSQPNNELKYRAPWTPVLVRSAAEPRALFLGTQYVMKTIDGGLHWETISPDLTGAQPQSNSQGPLTAENARQRGFGAVYTIAPSPLESRRDLGGKRYRIDSRDARWRQDLDECHSARAQRLEPRVADRGFAFRAGSRVCGGGSQYPRRSHALHLSNPRLRELVAIDHRRAFDAGLCAGGARRSGEARSVVCRNRVWRLCVV